MSVQLAEMPGVTAPPTTWWASSRMWRERIEDSWILFAPDRKGLPVVVSQPVASMLDICASGASSDEIIRVSCSNGSLTPEQARAALDFLIDQSFLRTEQDAARYTARDVSEYRPESFSIWLHINNHCNLDCAYCFVDKSKTEMSDDVMDKTIDMLVNTIEVRNIKNFSLKFAGGEPTLSVDRMERFRNRLSAALEGSPCAWNTAILSNGTVMSDRLIAFLKQPRTGLSISLDGYGAAGHDIFRVFKGSNRGSWQIVERNIAKALKHGIVPYILATVSQESSKTLPDLVKWVYSQGLKMRLSVVRQPQSQEAYSSFRSTASRDHIHGEYAAMISTLNAAFEEAFVELERESYVMDMRNALNICELHFDSPSFSSCCGIGVNHMVINEKGEVASCPMTVHKDTVPMQPDILNSVQLTFAKHSPRDRLQNEGKNCLDCKWFPVCVSGCPINNLAVNGKAYTVSPLNPFYEYVIPRYITFFGRKLYQSAKRQGIEDFLILAA